MLLSATATALTLALQTTLFSHRVPNVPVPPKGADILAVVGDVAIRASDVEGFLWEARGDEVLEQLMTFQIVKAEAEREGILITDQQVNEEVLKKLKDVEAMLPVGTNPRDYLQYQQGLGPSRLYLGSKTDLLMTKLADKRFRPERYLKVSMFQIVPLSNTNADVDVAKRKITAARDRVAKGEDWAKVFKETITDPQAPKDGSMGWVDIDLFPPIVRSEVLNLKPGEISTVSQTDDGIQFFRLDGVGSEAKDQALEDMKAQVMPIFRQKLFNELRSKAKIEKKFGYRPAPVPQRPPGG
jgi:hypothetical protein